ncbi:MAG: hypothetical protein V3T55_04750, partial [Anaerolineales bacterium]
MDNTFYLKLLAEVHQGRLFEQSGQIRPYPGRSRKSFPAIRKVIVTGGGFLIRTGEVLKGIGAPGETSLFSSNGRTAS